MTLEQDINLECGADCSNEQYRFVTIGTDGKCYPMGTGNYNVVGIQQNSPRYAYGERAVVRVIGPSRLYAADIGTTPAGVFMGVAPDGKGTQDHAGASSVLTLSSATQNNLLKVEIIGGITSGLTVYYGQVSLQATDDFQTLLDLVDCSKYTWIYIAFDRSQLADDVTIELTTSHYHGADDVATDLYIADAATDYIWFPISPNTYQMTWRVKVTTPPASGLGTTHFDYVLYYR